MKKLSCLKRTAVLMAVFLLFIAACPALAVTPAGEAAQGVVRIVVSDGTGTGFFVGVEGEPVQYLITNAHVAGIDHKDGSYSRGNSRIWVVFEDLYSDSTMEAEVVKLFENVDLAILKLMEPTTLRKPLKLMSAQETEVLETAYALGFPGVADSSSTLDSTVDDITGTKGVISRKNLLLEGDDYLLTDVSVNPGNSGGPLVTEEGYVVGINSGYFTEAENAYLALYIDYAMEYLDSEGIPYQQVSRTGTVIAAPSVTAQPATEETSAPETTPRPAQTEKPAQDEDDDTSDDVYTVGRTTGSERQKRRTTLFIALSAILLVGVGLCVLLIVRAGAKRKKAAAAANTVPPAPPVQTPATGYAPVRPMNAPVPANAPVQAKWSCPRCGCVNDDDFCTGCGLKRPAERNG